MWTWHKCWMGIYPTQIFPFSNSLCRQSQLKWSRRAWGRCKTITLLSCLSSSRCKFSMLQGIRIHHWSIRRNTRFHRKTFRAIILLACSRGLSLSRTYPTLWHAQLPLHAFALLHWRFWLSLDCTISSKYQFQPHFSPFCWSCALTLRNRQQILVPQVSTLMQASTYFPETRRMLLFHAPLIWTHFWPASTLLRGHLTLATLSLRVNDPQISEHLGPRSWRSPGQM